MSSENTYLPTLHQADGARSGSTFDPDAALTELIAKYGETSNAALMFRLEMLFEIMCSSKSGPESYEPLRRRIEQHYTLEQPSASPLAKSISRRASKCGDVIYSFSPQGFFDLYGNDYSAIDPKLLTIDSQDDFRHLGDRAWYLYVVTADEQLLVLDNPMDVTDLVSNRNLREGAAVPPVHPALVHDRGFAVKAAGEFGIRFDRDMPWAAIVNTKSGHFCPSPDSGSIAVRAFRKRLGDNATIALIPVRMRKSEDGS